MCCSPRPNNFDSDYLQFVKDAGLTFQATGVPQISAGNITTPIIPAPGINMFLPAFISDLELYTMASGIGPVGVGVGGPGVNPLNPIDIPAARSGLPNPLGPGATANTRLPSPTRPIIDGWLAGPTGWTTFLGEFAAAYLKMGKMGELNVSAAAVEGRTRSLDECALLCPVCTDALH